MIASPAVAVGSAVAVAAAVTVRIVYTGYSRTVAGAVRTDLGISLAASSSSSASASP